MRIKKSKKQIGVDCASTGREAENRKEWKEDCCEVVCGASTTLQGYRIVLNRPASTSNSDKANSNIRGI